MKELSTPSARRQLVGRAVADELSDEPAEDHGYTQDPEEKGIYDDDE